MFAQVEALESSTTDDDQTAATFVHTGVELYQKLNTVLDVIKSLPQRQDPQTRLAVANCCAVCLYFCHNFTFYPSIAAFGRPALSESETKQLVTDILNEAEHLNRGNAPPGILLLFPLRVAGVSARGALQRNRVVGALDTIYSHGFAVAQWLRRDVEHLWQWQEDIK
jgi:hypothetical protein